MKFEIGRKLKKLRIEKGLTQKELAAGINGGIDYTYIGKIERGEQLPSLKILLKISDALNVPAYCFFHDEPAAVLADARLQRLVREKGNELLDALRLLHEDDVSLVTEIIRVLARHRESVKEKEDNRALVAAEEKPPYGEG